MLDQRAVSRLPSVRHAQLFHADATRTANFQPLRRDFQYLHSGAVLGMALLDYTGGTARESKIEGRHFFLGYASKGQNHFYKPVSRLNLRVHQGIDRLFFAGIPIAIGAWSVGFFL